MRVSTLSPITLLTELTKSIVVLLPSSDSKKAKDKFGSPS
jgi:hypothetical protein